MNTGKICFNGCSFTVGSGFVEDQRDQFVYDRLVCKTLGVERKNIAVAASSNLLIFQRSANEIVNGDSAIIFSQWSALNRLWLFPGPDSAIFLNNESIEDFRYHNTYVNKKKLQTAKDVFLVLNHDYQNILDLCLYIKILEDLGKLYNKKVYHINGLLPWKEDLVNTYNEKDLYSSLSEYTKQILEFDSRSDSEILKFYGKIKKSVSQLDKSRWVNIFDSWQGNRLDTGPLGHHPGIKCNQHMANKTIEFLEKTL